MSVLAKRYITILIDELKSANKRQLTNLFAIGSGKDEARGSMREAHATQIVLDHGRAAKVEELLRVLVQHLEEIGARQMGAQHDDGLSHQTIGVAKLVHQCLDARE